MRAPKEVLPTAVKPITELSMTRRLDYRSKDEAKISNMPFGIVRFDWDGNFARPEAAFAGADSVLTPTCQIGALGLAAQRRALKSKVDAEGTQAAML